MSWITEILSAVNDIKDPFVKFLVRMFLLLVVLFALYLAFALITGKKIIFNNGTYEIVDAKTADSIAAAKVLPVKPMVVTPPLEQRRGVRDTVFVTKQEVIDKPKQPLRDRKSSEPESPTTSTAVEPTVNPEPLNPGDLTTDDKREIDKRINELIGTTYSHDHLPIGIYYINEDNSSNCAYQLKNYLEDEGFWIMKIIELNNTHFSPGFSLQINHNNPLPEGFNRIGISIGTLTKDRKYRIGD